MMASEKSDRLRSIHSDETRRNPLLLRGGAPLYLIHPFGHQPATVAEVPYHQSLSE